MWLFFVSFFRYFAILYANNAWVELTALCWSFAEVSWKHLVFARIYTDPSFED